MKKLLSITLSLLLLAALPVAADAGTASTPPQYNASQCAQFQQSFQDEYQGQPQQFITSQFNLAFPSCNVTPSQKSQGQQNFADLTINMVKNVENSVQGLAFTVGKVLMVIFLSVSGIKIMAGDGLKLAEIVKVLATYGVLAGLIIEGPTILQGIFNDGINFGQQVSGAALSNIKTSIMQAGSIQGVPPALIIQSIPGAVGTDVGSVANNAWSSFTNVIANIYRSMSPVGSGATIAGLIAVVMSLPSLVMGSILVLALMGVSLLIILETLFIHLDNDVLVAISPLVFALAIAEPYRSLVPNLISAVLKLALKNIVLYVMLGLYYVLLGVLSSAIIADNPAQMLSLALFLLVYGFLVWHTPHVIDGLFPGSPPSGAKAFGMAAMALGTEMAVGAAVGGSGNLLGPGGGLGKGLGGALKGGLQPLHNRMAKKAGLPEAKGAGDSKADKHGAEIAKNLVVSSGWEKADNIPGPSQAASLSKVDMGGGSKPQEVVSPPPTQFGASSSASAPSASPSSSGASSSFAPQNSPPSPSSSSSAPVPPSSAPPPSDNKKGQ